MGRFTTLAPAEHAPHDLNRLFPREREIALFVYARGCVTAKEVEAAIGGLTNAAVRSMLNRLVKKGLVTRQELKAPNPFVYGPAITDVGAQESAIRQCAEDFFDGSIEAVAAALADLYSTRHLPVGRDLSASGFANPTPYGEAAVPLATAA